MIVQIGDFIFGAIVGAVLVGSSAQRTISVHTGDVKWTLISALLNSASYFVSIMFIVKTNVIAYIGTVVGSTIIVYYMSKRNKHVGEILKKPSPVSKVKKQKGFIEPQVHYKRYDE